MKVSLWLATFALALVGLQGCKHERRYIEPVEQRRVNVELKGKQQQDSRKDNPPKNRQKKNKRSERQLRY